MSSTQAKADLVASLRLKEVQQQQARQLEEQQGQIARLEAMVLALTTRVGHLERALGGSGALVTPARAAAAEAVVESALQSAQRRLQM